jgi:hypothetical protein
MSGYSKEDDFDCLPEEVKNYILDVNSEIISCFQCQPYDSEEEDIVWVHGDRYEISDILSENDVPEELWEEILPFIECPNCGNIFETLSDEVGIMGEYEIDFQNKFDKIVKLAKGEIQSFYNFLARFPYLGAEHEVGKEIIKEIKEMPLIKITDKIYYRARKPENGKIFRHKDMLNPPGTVSIPEGRFNHYGQSHLYLGETEELCAKEIANEDKELLWMQKYKIKSLTNVLDVSEFIDPYNINNIPLFFAGLFQSRIISFQKSNKIFWTPEYFIPRFIADTARHNKINGIIYLSEKARGRNLVIFNLIECQYELDGEPYTYVFDRESYEESLF